MCNGSRQADECKIYVTPEMKALGGHLIWLFEGGAAGEEEASYDYGARAEQVFRQMLDIWKQASCSATAHSASTSASGCEKSDLEVPQDRKS